LCDEAWVSNTTGSEHPLHTNQKGVLKSFMKRKCKKVYITDLKFIEDSIRECLKSKKKDRRDIVRIKNEIGDVEDIAKVLKYEMVTRKLVLKPILYTRKYDDSSKKWREIGIQDIKQQIYDYIAVRGMKELIPRIGKYQCASLKKRGQIYCANAVYNHLQDKSIKYAAKLDIRKYYESIPKDKLMEWLKRHIKNEFLLWLINELIGTYKKGLSIGSYLSQYLANLYLSDLYHELEGLHRIRIARSGRIKTYKVVSFQTFYMDDILILGKSAKHVMRAVEYIIQRISEMGLTIKDNWRCFKIGNSFIDIAGYRIYRDHMTIRRDNLKRTRRAYIRFDRNDGNINLARRCVSFKGPLIYSDSRKFRDKYKVDKLSAKARKVVSKHDKGKVRLQIA
jgi:hypothetical protein